MPTHHVPAIARVLLTLQVMVVPAVELPVVVQVAAKIRAQSRKQSSTVRKNTFQQLKPCNSSYRMHDAALL